jgi:hypothetical protein
MRFTLALPGHGWAEVGFEHGDQSYRIDVSYLVDSLHELLYAVVLLLRGSDSETVTFMQEPGESVLVLKHLPGDLVQLKIFAGEDWGRARPDADEPVFRHTMSLDRFARLVLGQFRSLLLELGLEGYEDHWTRHRFPQESFDRLGRLLQRA